MIERTIDSAGELTTYTVAGTLLADEVLRTIDGFYQETVTKNVLWDLSEADLRQISSADVRLIVGRVTQLGRERPGGRTALVAPQKLAVGLSRMYEMLADLERPLGSAETRVFQNIDEALEWFKSSA